MFLLHVSALCMAVACKIVPCFSAGVMHLVHADCDAKKKSLRKQPLDVQVVV